MISGVAPIRRCRPAAGRSRPTMATVSTPRNAGLYVPYPYPDELLYSVLARHVRHLGLSSPKRVLTRLFGRNLLIASSDLPGHLDCLRWLLETRWAMPLEEAAMRLTLLPYYLSNRTAQERACLTQSLIEDTTHSLHTQLGICASTVLVPSVLRFCHRCCEQDFERLGETYWRRAHQLPGVLVCPEHGVPLALTDVAVRSRGRHEYVALTAQTIDTAHEAATLPAESLKAAREVAQLSRRLLDGVKGDVELLEDSQIPQAVHRAGYRGKQAAASLERAFVAFFGPSFLLQIDRGFAERGVLTWVRGIGRKPRYPMHPLRRVLFTLFLAQHAHEPGSSAFGAGPWVCINPLAEHHGRAVIAQIEPFRDRRHPERTLARFRCSCGFVYSRALGHERYTVIERGPLYRREAARLRAKGLTVHAVARRLELDWETVARLLRPEPSGLRELSETQRQDRMMWLNLLNMHPGRGVNALRREQPALYARLYRHSRAWLASHRPACGAAAQVGDFRRDWVRRDKDYLARVHQVVRELREEYPTRRITRNAVAMRLGSRALFQKQLNRLPQTRAYLERVEESPVEYRVRRLHAAFERMAGRPSEARLLRAANIRSSYVDDRLRAEVSRLLLSR